MHYILIENPVFGLAIRVFTPSFIVRRLGKLLLNQNRKNRNTKKVLLVLSLAAVILTSTVLANPASALAEDVSGEVVQGLENGGDSGSGAQAPAQAAVEQADAQGNEAASSSDPQETLAAPSADQGVMNANSVSAVDSAAVTENGTGDSGIAVSGAEADGTKKSADQISAAEGSGTAEQGATLAEAAETVSTEEAAADKTTEKTEQAAQSETDVLSFADDRAQVKIARKDGTGFPSDTTMSGSPLGTDDWNRVLSAVSSKVKAQSDDSTAYSVAGLHTWTLSLQAGDGSAASYDDIRAEAEFQGGLNDAGYATKTSEKKEENGTDGTSITTASYETSWRVYAISGDSIADPVEDHLTDLTDADGTSLSVDENGALQSAAFDGSLPETVVFAQLVRETVTTGTEKKEEIPMPAVTFDKEAATDHGTITVHVEADEGTFEQGTTMSVKQVSSQDILDKAIEAAGGRGSAAAVDISFRKADGTETEPAKPIRVKMTAKVLGQADKVHVVHVDDTGSTDVVAKKSDGKTIESTSSEAASSDAKNTVSFESDSFSVYAIVYTVDFETVDGIKWSWPGKGVYSVESILAELGVYDIAESATLVRTIDEGGAENALYLEEREDGWYVISEVAFTDTFELRIHTGEKDYVIIIKDAMSNDLTGFITKVDIDAPVDADGKYEVRKGKPINIDLSFKEKSSLQFDLDQMTYPIPAGLDAVEGVKGYLTITATDGDETYTIDGNEYEVKDGVLILKWNKDHPDFEHLEASKNTEIKLHISASLDGTKSTIPFGNGITKDFNIDDPHGVSVEKSSFNLNKETGEVDYLITVTSTGDTSNIVVTDSIPSTSKALSNITGTVKVYNNKDDRRDVNLVPGVNVTSDTASGFSLTIPSMTDGQTFAIVYKGKVDFSKLTQNADGSYGVDADTLNNVTAKPDNWPGDNSSITQGKIFAKPEVSKKAGTASDVVDGKRTTEWTMTATSINIPGGQSSLAGGWIKDTIDNSIVPGTNKTSQDLMKYSGTGIKVVVTNENNEVLDTRNIRWEDINVNPATATSWTYPVPDSGIDKNTTGKLTYTITYTTETVVSELISDVQVKNEGDSNKGEPSTGKADIGPIGENEAGVDKKVTNVDQDNNEVSWEVDITVPAAGLTVATLEDIYPRQWNDDNAPYDTLKAGSITYEGLLAGEGGITETKTEDTTNPKKLLITFGYTDSNGVSHTGLYGTGEQRVVKVRFTTKNSADWNDDPNRGGNRNHVNTAKFTGNQKVFTDTATAVPSMRQKITKTAKNDGKPTGIIDVNGVELPVWTYEVVLEGVLPDSEITDTFDDRLVFVPFEVVDFGQSTSQPGVLYGGVTSNDMQSYVGNYINTYGTKLDAYVDANASGNSVVFHIDEGNIPKYAYHDGTQKVENQYFKIIYQLRVKDEASLESLMAEAAARPNKTLDTIKNTAVFGPSSSEQNVKYEYSPVSKEMINSSEVGGLNNIGKFKIVVNPSGLDLDPESDYLTMTDEIIENLSIVYDSISASPSQGVKWTFSNNVATFTVPDGIPVTITYDALIIGNGNVHFRNEATVNGQTSVVDDTKNVQSKAEGTSSNPIIKIKKHKAGEMTTPLVGAEFQLFEFVCADGKTEDDCWRVPVPGTSDPVVHGLNRNKLVDTAISR